MSLQTMLTNRASGFSYFNGQATPDRQSDTTKHFTARMAENEFVDSDGTMPLAYANGLITVRISLFSLSTQTGNVDFQVAPERLDPDGNENASDGFTGAQSAAPVPISAVFSATTRFDITFSQAQFDGITGGDDFRIRITRLVSTTTGDLFVKNVQFISDL